MKAIKVAIFLEMMKDQMIPYTFDGLAGSTFKAQYGAKGFMDVEERYGYYLVAYVTEKSLAEEEFLRGVKNILKILAYIGTYLLIKKKIIPTMN